MTLLIIYCKRRSGELTTLNLSFYIVKSLDSSPSSKIFIMCSEREKRIFEYDTVIEENRTDDHLKQAVLTSVKEAEEQLKTARAAASAALDRLQLAR